MNEISTNLWLSFNIIFGLWSLRNWAVFVYAKLTDKLYVQSNRGQLIDMFTLVSCLAYYLTYY